jgi:asparagine synthase (glutamine-hydrolysing)
MDHRIVEWMATLPSSFKVRRNEGKVLLKTAAEPMLPNDLLYRTKMGFAVPLARWLRGPLHGRLREALLGERLAATEIFNQEYVATLVEDHAAGRRDHSTPLWTLLMFDAFLRNVAGGSIEHGLVGKAA